MTTDRMESRPLQDALATTRPAALDQLDPQLADEALAVLERRAAFIDRLIPYAIGATDPSQWTMIGDTPWPGGPAAEAMARRCGVSWDEPTASRTPLEDDGGPPGYRWTYRARFYLPGRIDSVWAEGHCDSRDPFLGTGPRGEVRSLPEVVEGSIMQSAMTNLKVNGICTLLGVRRMSKARLDAIFEAKGGTAGMGRAEFQAGARGGGTGSSQADPVIRFGNAKGKRVSELSDPDLSWYQRAFTENVADPDKAKYRAANVTVLAALDAELARRKAGAQQPPPAAAGAKPPGLYAQVVALFPEGTAPEHIVATIFAATGKKRGTPLVAEDLAAVREHLAKRQDPTLDEWGNPLEPGTNG
jgi:hypothetical protein